MALSYAQGVIQWLAADAATSTYAVSGLSFQPKFIRFDWCGLQSASDAASEAVNERRGVGFATGTADRRCIGTRNTDASASSDCGNVARNDSVACTHSAAGTTDGLLDLTAIASDGFTLTVDDATPANITVFWKAWGGSDITAQGVGDFAEPAATGDQSYTATGFVGGATDQVVMVGFCQATAAVNTSTPNVDSGLSFGFGDGTTSVFVMGNSDEASGAMDTDGAGQSGAILGMCTAGGSSTLNSLANLTGFGTDTITVNWSATANTARKGIYGYIKGGAWKVGEYTIAGDTGSSTTTVSGLTFAPIGINVIGLMATESAGSAGTNDRMSLGGGTSTTNRHAWGLLDENATASSVVEINTVLEYDSVLAFPSDAGALLASYDISAMNSDGFTIIVDTAGGVASEWQGYLAFASGSANWTLAVTKADLQPAPKSVTLNKTWSTVITAAALQPAPKSIAFDSKLVVGKADLQPSPQTVALNKTWSLSVTTTDLQPVSQVIALEKTWSIVVGKADLQPPGQNITLTWQASLSIAVDAASLSIVGQTIEPFLTIVDSERPSGGWVESAYEKKYARLNDEIRRELEEELEREALADRLEKVLVDEGALTQAQADLIRLRGLAEQYSRDDLPNRARRALAFAERAQSELASKLALRELRRVAEEEEYALLLLMTLD